MALVAALLLFQPQPYGKEFGAALDKARKLAADKHFELGCLLAERGMHDWAKTEYEAAVSMHPDHTGARTRLGFRADEFGRWARDPELKVKTGNRKEEGARKKAEADYSAALTKAMREVGAAYEVSAKEADKVTGFGGEAAASRRYALDFEPDDAALRAALGYAQADGIWVKGAWLGEMAKAEETASAGAKHEDKSPVEEKLKIALEKRASPNFLLESSYKNQESLGKLVALDEAALHWYKRIFNRDRFFKDRIESVIFKTRDEHVKFIDAFVDDERTRDMLRKADGRIKIDLHEKCLDDNDEEAIEDHVVHATLHSLVLYDMAAFRPWQIEGTAYFFTRTIRGTARNKCTTLPSGTVSGDLKKAFTDHAHWRAALKKMVTEWEDPPAVEVLKSDMPGLTFGRTLKAWSLIEFLLLEHTEKFIKWWDRLRDDPEDAGDAALRDVFGWTAADLDTFWRIWVRSQP